MGVWICTQYFDLDFFFTSGLAKIELNFTLVPHGIALLWPLLIAMTSSIGTCYGWVWRCYRRPNHDCSMYRTSCLSDCSPEGTRLYLRGEQFSCHLSMKWIALFVHPMVLGFLFVNNTWVYCLWLRWPDAELLTSTTKTSKATKFVFVDLCTSRNAQLRRTHNNYTWTCINIDNW